MLLEFPTEAEWRSLSLAYDYKKLEISEDLFPYLAHTEGSIQRFTANQEIFFWVVHLQNRIAQTTWSHRLMMYYFNKGIPDDEWFISPGRKGQSVEYYPHFEDRDDDVKMMFDYYADIFYYKLFSAWDNLGHLLNIQHDMKIDRATFYTAVKKLKASNDPLWLKLQAIRDSPDFITMTTLRHDITHNELPGHIGSSIRKTEDGITFGGGSYTPSKQIRDNAIKSLDLFVAAIEAIRTLGSPVFLAKRKGGI